jgi:hypothetical protein
MAKRQTRRSISLRAEEYVRAQHLAEHLGLPVAAAIEAAIGKLADAEGVPKVDRADALRVLAKQSPPLPPDDGALRA